MDIAGHLADAATDASPVWQGSRLQHRNLAGKNLCLLRNKPVTLSVWTREYRDAECCVKGVSLTGQQDSRNPVYPVIMSKKNTPPNL